jgi:hypothetical protein
MENNGRTEEIGSAGAPDRARYTLTRLLAASLDGDSFAPFFSPSGKNLAAGLCGRPLEKADAALFHDVRGSRYILLHSASPLFLCLKPNVAWRIMLFILA